MGECLVDEIVQKEVWNWGHENGSKLPTL